MLYAWCCEYDKWPGYQIYSGNKWNVEQLDLPPWAIKEFEYFPKHIEWLR